jgi:hypothetical protein
MNKKNRFPIASSLVLLAIFFSLHGAFAQIPKLFLKFVEKQNKVQSGYVKLQEIYVSDNDTSDMFVQEGFFISTPKDLKYLSYHLSPFDSSFYCKSAHTLVAHYTRRDFEYIRYRYYDKNYNAKFDENHILSFSTANGFSLGRFKNAVFQRMIPKINKKNIRYKIVYPDDDINSNRSLEYEFNRKTFNWVQEEFSLTYDKIEWIYGKTDILEQCLYDYIHPDILDTISFKYEEIKKGYDKQYAAEQSKKDSVFRAHLCDSIAQLLTNNGSKWIENILQDAQKDTLFFMPEWKFPLLSGDTIYSDSIKSKFLLIDMWYVSCHPCRLAMRELASIDTLYDESLLKMVSLNVADKDTAKMNQVVRNLNLKCDVVCAYDSGYDIYMSKKMGNCQGYPQLYLIDMGTKQVIWNSCGYYKGFTKDIEEIIKGNDEQ